MPKLTNEQVHVKLLELMGYKIVSGLSGILELFKDGQPQRFPPLDHNLIWEAEEKLLGDPSTKVKSGTLARARWGVYHIYIMQLTNDDNKYYSDSFIDTRHVPAIICARALLKTLGVDNA